MSWRGSSLVDYRQWPNVTVITSLPNVAGSPTQSANVVVGDSCFVTGTAHFYFCTVATLGAAVWRSGAESVLAFGAGSVAATTTTRYLPIGFDGALAPTAPVQFRMPIAGMLRNMRVRHNTTAGNGNAIVYTLRVNSVASALTVSLASTAADGSDLVNTVTVAAGDLIDVIVTKAASVGASPSDIMAAIALEVG